MNLIILNAQLKEANVQLKVEDADTVNLVYVVFVKQEDRVILVLHLIAFVLLVLTDSAELVKSF